MASVDWGPWGEESKGKSRAFKPKSLGALTCYNDDFAKATTNTMVIGRIISFLAKKVQPNIPGSLKTFCIGHSLGGHICGFAGKDYRFKNY